MDNNNILNLRGICKNFGGIQALKGVDFELRKGEIHALLGENGAGKSTLIKILTGVYKPDDGDILLNGKPVHINGPIDARNKGIAAIYQELSLIESLTVAENIFLGNEPTATAIGYCKRKQLYRDSDEFLQRFGIKIDSHAVVSSLGLGQKRIVEIVKALAINADILLLDEPTTGMSKVEIDTLFEIMESLKSKNVTMIYISHYLDEVFRCCDRSTVFRDGRNVNTFDMRDVDVATLVRAMIGHNVQSDRFRPAKHFQDGAPAMEAISFQTDAMRAPISFRAYPGEILGFTGIVGAGKSELANSLFGACGMARGELKYAGASVRPHSPHDTAKHGVVLIPEDRKTQGLFLADSIEDNIVLPHMEQTENRFGLLDGKKKHAIATQMGEQLKLHPMNVRMAAGNLSGGNQQKVVLGKWLTGDPKFVLMDEPTRGIDIGAKTEIYRLITTLANEGKTVLVFTSEFGELVSICDRIIVLCKGEVAGEMIAEEATTERLLTLSLGGAKE